MAHILGSDFTLDINNPDAPKIVCLANNPQKQQVYGAVLSLYISRMIKIIAIHGFEIKNDSHRFFFSGIVVGDLIFNCCEERSDEIESPVFKASVPRFFFENKL